MGCDFGEIDMRASVELRDLLWNTDADRLGEGVEPTPRVGDRFFVAREF